MDARVLDDLHRARATRRRARLSASEIAWRLYVGLFFATYAAIYLSVTYAARAVEPQTLDLVRRHGTAGLGAVVTAIVVAGIRSGARGGPTTPSPGDIGVVLMSPVDRGRFLRRLASRQAIRVGSVAISVGCVFGFIAGTELPGNIVLWIVSGAAFALACSALAWGAAMLVAGSHLTPAVIRAAVIALWLLAFLTLAGTIDVSLADAIARLGLLPMRESPLSVVAIGSAAVVVVSGLRAIGRTRLEPLTKRGSLNASLRYAVLMRDFREVVLIRRHLTGEQSRSRPWLDLGLIGRSFIWGRYWRSIMRWPAARFARFCGAAVVAGLSAVAFWTGARAAIVVTIVCLFVAGLDAIEPVGQDIDRSGVPQLAPRDPRWILIRHLVGASVLMIGFCTIACVAATTIMGTQAFLPGVAVAILSGPAAAASAAIAVIGEPRPLVTSTDVLNPFGSASGIISQVQRPAVAGIGLLPLVLSTVVDEARVPLFIAGSICAAVVLVVVFVWIRFGPAIRNRLAQIRDSITMMFWKRRA